MMNRTLRPSIRSGESAYKLLGSTGAMLTDDARRVPIAQSVSERGDV